MGEDDLGLESPKFELDSKKSCLQEAIHKLAVKVQPCSIEKLCEANSSSRSSCSSTSISAQCLFSNPDWSVLKIAEEC